MSKRMPKLVDLKVLREEAQRVRRAQERLERALAERKAAAVPDKDLERRALYFGDLYYRATERFARMTMRWLDATDPFRAKRSTR